MSEAVNPYAAPTAPVEDVPANPEAEALRRAHIGHEASIKAVGFLYYLGAVLGTLIGLAFLVGMRGADAASGAVLLAIGVAQLFAGYGVRRLRRWARILGCILSAIGLLAFPVGTLINAYILYLFLAKKGRTIFSEDYQRVIEATPHVKYRTSIILWIFLGLLVAFLAFAVLWPMFAR